MPVNRQLDRTDAALLRALNADPRATVISLAETLSLSRNTVQSRLARMESGAIGPFERRVLPGSVGYPIEAAISMIVEQQLLDEIAAELAHIPEVLSVLGVSGGIDLLVMVAAQDADALYGVAGRVLSLNGVVRTETHLVMRQLVPRRIMPLIERLAGTEPQDHSSETA